MTVLFFDRDGNPIPTQPATPAELARSREILEAFPPEPAPPKHEWLTTEWGHDFYAYQCKLCKLETHTRKGYPAATLEECQRENTKPCKS